MHSILAILFIVLGTFTQVTLSNPGILTVTVDSAHLPANGKLESVQIKRGENGECKNVLISKQNPIQFSINWNECTKKIRHDDMMHDIEMRIRLSGGNGVVIKLGEYSFGLYKHLFVGGKAKIFSEGTHPRLVYVEDPSGIAVKPPGTLTFDVNFSKRTIVSLDQVEIKHTDNKPMHGCKTHILDKNKFSVDLAKCNVHHVEDVADLDIEIHLTLFLDEKTGPLSAPLHLLWDEKDLLKKFYNGGEAKIVFHPHESPKITYQRQQQQIASNEPNTPKQKHHASASAASSSHHGPEAEAEEEQHKTAGWKGKTEILFVAPNDVKTNQIFVADPNKKDTYVVVDVKDIKAISEGEHKMMLRKDGGDGPECPVKIIKNFYQNGETHALLQVDWENCSEKVKTPEDLVGMRLHLFYTDSEGKMEPKEIRCRLGGWLLERFFNGEMFYVVQTKDEVKMDTMIG